MPRSAGLERFARARVTVIAAALFGYAAIARVVDNLYPFSTFSMYAEPRAASASRVVARDASGSLHELDEYVAWSCERPVDVAPERCETAPFYAIGYIDRAAVEYVARESRDDPRAEPVEIVRHIWRFRDERATEDCVLDRCRAVRR